MLSREHWAAVLRSNAELLSPETPRRGDCYDGKSTPAIAADSEKHEAWYGERSFTGKAVFPGAA